MDIAQQVEDLNQQLNRLSTGKAYQIFLDPQYDFKTAIQQQQNLSDKLLHEIKKIEKRASTEESQGTEGHVEYELYYNPAEASAQNMSGILDIEKKINQLEKLIGSYSENESLNLEAKVSELEKKISLLDPKVLDSLHERILALGGELNKISNKTPIVDVNNIERVLYLFISVNPL